MSIKPANLLSQYGLIIKMAYLLHLSLTCQLEERYLEIGEDEHSHSYANKRKHLIIDCSNKFIISDTRALLTTVDQEVRVRGGGGELGDVTTCITKKVSDRIVDKEQWIEAG